MIVHQWHDRKVTPPRLPRRVVSDAAAEVCARVGVIPVYVDLPETEVLRGQGVPGSSPSSPSPSAGSFVWPPPPRHSALMVGVRRGDSGVSPPSPFSFPSPSTRIRLFPSSGRPCRLFRFPLPVSSVFSLRVVRCSSRWVWGATMAHCPRHRQDKQAQAALQHSHHAVLHVDVGAHLQQVSTAGQANCTGSVV